MSKIMTLTVVDPSEPIAALIRDVEIAATSAGLSASLSSFEGDASKGDEERQDYAARLSGEIERFLERRDELQREDSEAIIDLALILAGVER